MGLVSEEARNASLAMSYGADRHPTLSLDQLEVALYVGDPRETGVELTGGGGYAAVLVPNDGVTWPDPPAAGEIVTGSGQVVFTATDAWDDVPDYWAIRDPISGDLWDVMPFPGDGLVVDSARPAGVQIQLIVNYNALEA